MYLGMLSKQATNLDHTETYHAMEPYHTVQTQVANFMMVLSLTSCDVQLAWVYSIEAFRGMHLPDSRSGYP